MLWGADATYYSCTPRTVRCSTIQVGFRPEYQDLDCQPAEYMCIECNGEGTSNVKCPLISRYPLNPIHENDSLPPSLFPADVMNVCTCEASGWRQPGVVMIQVLRDPQPLILSRRQECRPLQIPGTALSPQLSSYSPRPPSPTVALPADPTAWPGDCGLTPHLRASSAEPATNCRRIARPHGCSSISGCRARIVLA